MYMYVFVLVFCIISIVNSEYSWCFFLLLWHAIADCLTTLSN
jgi:hypothetical protein